jgi:hypothetical protein
LGRVGWGRTAVAAPNVRFPDWLVVLLLAQLGFPLGERWRPQNVISRGLEQRSTIGKEESSLAPVRSRETRMDDSGCWRQVATGHAEDLLADEIKIQSRLRIYGFFSWVALVLGIIVPILAGSTVLAALNPASGWPLVSGILTLIASAGVALHKGLGCEAYHAKGHQALAELRSLVTAYGRLLAGAPINDNVDSFPVLEARLDKFYRDYEELLPRRPTRLPRPALAAAA